MMQIVTFILVTTGLIIYFLPSLIAAGRTHHQSKAILALNLLLGWTLLGWVGAMVWAFTAVDQPTERAISS